MDLKRFALTACLLIGGACAQDNQDYNSPYTGLSGIGSNQNVGSDLNSTELVSLPRLDVSLQQLIDDASDDSSIRIPLDTYKLSEPLHINKNITLIGSPFDYIDGQGASQILQMDNPMASVTMKNFLLIHGSGDYGGAITSQAKSLTVRDCRFLDNLANYGAGIYQKGSNLRIVDTSFERNNATIWGAAIYEEGGDMQVESSKFTQNPGSYVICINGTLPRQAQVLIRNCNVSNNPGPYNNLNSGFGGAIVCDNSTTIIDHCIIKGNRALVMTPTFLGGGNAGLVFGSSNVTLNDTLIEGNEARYIPAIYIGQNSTVAVNRCTITGNRALSVLYKGEHADSDVADFSISPGSEVVMDNVSISNNKVDGKCGAISNGGILSLKNVRIYGNTAGNYSAIRNSKNGIVNIGNDVRIFNNNGAQEIYSEGILNMDFS